MAAPVKVAGQQTTPELSGTFQTLPPEPTLSGTLRNLPEPTFQNLPEPTSKTYPGTLRNLPEPSGTYAILHRTLRNLLEPASGTYTSICQNPPEPSGTCLRNLHQHTPELSGTFRNLPPEPAPATCTGTHRSLFGLKTPLAYTVGEKKPFQSQRQREWSSLLRKPKSLSGSANTSSCGSDRNWNHGLGV